MHLMLLSNLPSLSCKPFNFNLKRLSCVFQEDETSAFIPLYSYALVLFVSL